MANTWEYHDWFKIKKTEKRVKIWVVKGGIMKGWRFDLSILNLFFSIMLNLLPKRITLVSIWLSKVVTNF